MATPQQIQQAMRLAMQDGDQGAVAELRQMLTQAYQSEVPNATEGMSGLDKFRAGIGQGMTNIARQAQNLVGLRSDEELQEAAQRDRALLDTGAGKAGSFLGEIAATAPVGGLAGAGAKAAATRAGLNLFGRGAAGTAAMGATQGAAEGALTAGPDSRVTGALAGAAGGAALPLAVSKIGRTVARGVEPSAAAKRLMEQGVDLTPGQMNPRSALGQLEGAMKSVPLVGGAIEGAQDSAKAGWRGLARTRALAPGATRGGTLDEVYEGYRPAYDAAKGFPVSPRIMRTAGRDMPLADFPTQKGAFTRAARNPAHWASEGTRDTAKDWLKDQVGKLPDKGRGADPFDSEKLLKLRSDLRDRGRQLSQSPNPDEGALAIVREAEQRVTEALESQLPAKAMQALRAADKQYRVFKQVEKATDDARRRGSAEFTPTELARAANKADDEDMWKLANQGKLVFDQGPPPTGARAVTLGIPGLAAAASGLPVLGPAANLLGVAALSATKPGRRIAGGMTAPQKRAQAMIAALRRKLGYQGRDFTRLYANMLGAQTLADFYDDGARVWEGE